MRPYVLPLTIDVRGAAIDRHRPPLLPFFLYC